MTQAVSRIGIIGAGRLGTMLARAFARFSPGLSIQVATRNGAVAADLARELPAVRLVTMQTLAANCDLVLLAVPPDAYRDVIGDIAAHLSPDAILVSLTNGVTLDALAHATAAPVVKVIPTMAHTQGRGVALVIAGPAATEAHVARVRACLDAIATPVVITEPDSRAASNIAGSALAFTARFAEALVAAHDGRTHHIDASSLTAMMAETLNAVGALLEAGHSCRTIIEATATPGGVTEAGLAALDVQLPQLAEAIVQATYARQHAMQIQQG